ncbi:hypothetical protein [Bacteriovorax sp. Seq25_V]|uniref:hypothetical protein n=1 Tax=Bacteriovorax sp. Seq25_V TaxID=1201288 RepID=UPI00038A26EA|nr:hypothetical protein [Bacteriovorax sp. Seq25_V]EQC45271.1 hypothetical protein M900_2013 [Bacteriovorax sp. Seq25_V]
MRNLILLLAAFLTVSTFSTKSFAYDLVDYGMIGTTSEEGLIKVDLPLPIIESEIQSMLLGDDSYIKSIDVLKLDPINRTLTFKGEVEMPESLLLTMEEKAGDKLKKKHDITLVITFPSARLLSASKYVQFKINRLELDGVDYSKGMNIISNVLPALLINRSLVNYFIDETKAPTDYSDKDISLLVKTFLETKAVKFRDNTISIRFNLSEFMDLKRFSYLEELRLWHFSPILIKGTKDRVAFRIEAGLGKPGKNWIAAAKERQDSDVKDLKELRKELYNQFKYTVALDKEINSYIDSEIDRIGLDNWTIRTEREIADLKSSISQRARKFLTTDDEIFTADPEMAYYDFKKEYKEYALNGLLDIKKRLNLEILKFEGGSNNKNLPLATKRLSQKAVNQFTNYFRDFEFDNEQLFSSLNVVLAPQLPGVVVRGEVNLNINSLLEMGLEGSGIDFAGPKVRFDEKTYGKSLPFELTLYSDLQDHSVLELDIKNLSIGTGQNRVVFANNSKNGDFLKEFSKMTIINVLKTYMMSDPLASTDSEGDTLTYDDIRIKLFEKIEVFKNNILGMNTKNLKGQLSDLIKIKALELNNPFNETPAQIAEAQIVEFFKDILGYDRTTGRIKIRLSPSIFADKIMNSDNNINIWNFEPLFDKKMDKTYLELSVGDGNRSKQYLKYLKERPENKDSQSFAGTSGNINNEGEVDYHLSLNLNEFEKTANIILKDSLSVQTEQVNLALDKDEESEMSLLEDITLKATADNSLVLNFTLLSIEKSKKGLVRRIFSNRDNQYDIEKSRSKISAKLKLTAINKDLYEKEILEKSPNEVFLGSTLLKVDLEAIGKSIENPGLLGKLMNKMIGNVNLNNSFLGINLKSILLKVAGPFLNERKEDNGNTVLGGFRLNQFMKVYTHSKEILLQINPRFAGPVWDFYISQNGLSNGTKVGVIVNSKDNTISFDFKSAFALSTVDKIELYKIMKDAEELSQLKRDNLIDVEKLSYYDKIFYNSDSSKPSLYHRLVKILEHYDNLVLAHSMDQDAKKISFEYTAAGAELMHIAAASTALRNVIRIFQDDSLILTGNYELRMSEIEKELTEKYITPMKKIYSENFEANNRKILRKNVTDWNYLVYPDAVFAQKAYEYIISED